MIARLASLACLLAAAASGQTVAPSGLSSARVLVAVPTPDFSDLAEPAATLTDLVARRIAQAGVVPEDQIARDGEAIRLSRRIETQIRIEVREAPHHDGYAGRIWIHDPRANTLVKVVVALCPAEHPTLSSVVLAHESGHAAAHERAVAIARENAIVSKVPGKKASQWMQEISKAEDAGARLFHARVGTTAGENVVRLGDGAEDRALLEAIGTAAAGEALVPLQPYSPATGR